MSRRWALILGASSGFGAAAARAYAAAGYDIIGVHLDRRATMPNAQAVIDDITAAGRLACFYNVNAADHERRAQTLESVTAELQAQGGQIEVLLHSLAFGTLLPLVGEGRVLKPRQLTMTLEVMANSLIWWTREVVDGGLMGAGGRVFAMTSSGSQVVIPSYGAVGAAKAALEAHCRQLSVELAPRGVAVNAIMAGVTDTPALQKIPGSDRIIAEATRRNPSGRLTTPQDVAQALVELSRPGLHWMTGNTLRIDGGEGIAG